MEREKWKPVAVGVLAASVGAAAFGAVHYMFLANQISMGQNLFGIPYTTILPIALGAIGMIAGGLYIKNPMLKTVITYGSAASIGFGIADYAGWVTPKTAPSLQARLFAPQRAFAPAASLVAPNATTKMI